MKKRIILTLAIACTVARGALADFSGYYAVDPNPDSTGFYRVPQVTGTTVANTWTISASMDAFRLQDPYVNVFPLSHLTLFGGYVATGGPHYITVTLTNTAPVSGLWSFDFSLDLGTPSVSSAYYFVNGTRYQLSAGSGSLTNIALNEGDTFGFGTSIGPSSIVNHFDAHATLQITNFSAPVPEPSTIALFTTALGAFGCGKLRAWRRTPNQARGCVISPKAKNPTHEDDL